MTRSPHAGKLLQTNVPPAPRRRPRHMILMTVVLAMFATLLSMAAPSTPPAAAQTEEDCTTYLAGAAGLLVYAEGNDPSTWSIDNSPSPWLLASLGFTGSGAAGGLSYNNDYIYASPGTNVEICIIDQIATVLTSQGSSNSTSSWSNVIYDAFGEEPGSLQDCIQNIAYLNWGLTWPFCFNYYDAAIVETTTTGYEVSAGDTSSTSSTSAVAVQDPNDVVLPASIADCFSFGSTLLNAYQAWQDAYNLWQFELANADFEDDPYEFWVATIDAYDVYAGMLDNTFANMPWMLYNGDPDPQVAFDTLTAYLLATGDTSVIGALDALGETLTLGGGLLEFPTGINPGAVGQSTWIIQACAISDALHTADQYLGLSWNDTEPPLGGDDVSDLATTIADCAALNTAITNALDALEATAGQIETHLALDPGDQDATVLAGLVATYETQSADLTSALVDLVDSFNFLTTSLEEIKAILGQYLSTGSALYELRDSDDPLFVIDDLLALDVATAVSVPHGGLEQGLTTIDEITAEVPEELADQIEWATELCDLAHHFGEALSFVNTLPAPEPELADAWVPLACDADGNSTGLTADDNGVIIQPGVVRDQTPIRIEPTGKIEQQPLEQASTERGERELLEAQVVRPTEPTRTEEEAPPTIEEDPGPVDSCSVVKKLVQVDIVGTQYENLSPVYGWKGYDPATDFGPGFHVQQVINGPVTYANADVQTSNYGSAIVVQVLNEALFVGRWSETFIATADEGEIRARLDELVGIDAVRLMVINGLVNIPHSEFNEYLKVRFDDAISSAGITGITSEEMVAQLAEEGAALGPEFQFIDAVGVDDGELIFELRSIDDILLRPRRRHTSHVSPTLLGQPRSFARTFLTVAGTEAHGARFAHQFAIADRQYEIVNDQIWAIFVPHLKYTPQVAHELISVMYPICFTQRAADAGQLEHENYWWTDMHRMKANHGTGTALTDYTFSYPAGSVDTCAEELFDGSPSYAFKPYNWDPFDWNPYPALAAADFDYIFGS